LDDGITIRGVPERTHEVLRKRAAAAHQSLQEYLLRHLIEEADRPTFNEPHFAVVFSTSRQKQLARRVGNWREVMLAA
jgi:plasmid stability protein